MMDKKKVAFICVHNSCRSQIAEALGKHLAGDKFDFYSAGTETILDKGIMPSEKVLDFPVDCNTLTGSVNL